MTYIDIYEIHSSQNKLINIYENVIHLCKNVQENIYCIINYSNQRFNIQKFVTANSIEKIHYLIDDTKIIIPEYLPNSIKDDFELKDEIFNIFEEAKYNSCFSSLSLNKTMTNINSTFNIRRFYNFWIQDNPEYKNDERSRVTEWLNDILGLFDVYLSSL